MKLFLRTDFPNCDVRMNHLETSVKCRFEFSPSGAGPRIENAPEDADAGDLRTDFSNNVQD